jgi:hypothetical protein
MSDPVSDGPAHADGTRHWRSRLVGRSHLQLDDGPGDRLSKVGASAGGHPLVACLAATDDVHTPEQAHARCMAALPRHPTAITARHYVIYRTAPPHPADLTAWPAPLATGTGRA